MNRLIMWTVKKGVTRGELFESKGYNFFNSLYPQNELANLTTTPHTDIPFIQYGEVVYW